MQSDVIKYLSLFVFVMGINLSQSQNLNLAACDTLQLQKSKNECVFDVYGDSQDLLNKSYKVLLGKLDTKIKSLKPEARIKTASLKQFLKDNQVQWLLTRNYNAKVHASYQLTTSLSDYAFYYSKAKESFERIIYFKTVADSLNLK
ncbi:MAG: DUF1311 domain-containing protein [Flavobacteriaceae bacterium]|nr:DUF1311 domain-containing protein [Flavobacteriaceae bacterium]